MKISENWLRQWVNPALTAEQIGEQLTMAGLELDGLEKVAQDFSGVVVGEVLEIHQHPDADKLKITKVNVGTHSSEPLQIVCGASNVAVGVRVPVALVGAVLPPVDGKPFHIKKGKLRGVESHGMLCGGSEIDCNDGVDGLLLLPSDAPIGADIRQYLRLDDAILDIAITPNRGDCFSVRGIAREVAVLNGLPFALPFDDVASDITCQTTQAVKVETADCPRYFAQVVENLSGTTASPDWLKTALNACGVKPRNLLVDVTNYVLLELGQPLHAFDKDKLVGQIIVRHAKQGETLELLNEQTVTLTGDELVIADEQGAIALAGIMGGLRTAVTDRTTSIVLENAFFKPSAIAGKARRFGLHTDASQRYERGVDFDLPKLALNRAVALLVQYGNGHAGNITLAETPSELPKRDTVKVKVAQINRLLGTQLDGETMATMLNALQIATAFNGETLTCTPPSHRYDIAIGEDIAEEVARIYGYNQIANQLPAFDSHLSDNKDYLALQNIKSNLINQGYYEAVSFSFSDDKVEQLFEFDTKPLALANPISSDLAVMRRTLLSSLLPCVQYNLNRQVSRVRLFEAGLRFLGDDVQSLLQLDTLTMVATGLANPEQPFANQAMDFYDLKHDVESLIPAHVLPELVYQRSQRSFLHTGQSADVYYQGQNLGYLGQLHPSLAKALDLPTTWVAEFDLTLLKTIRQKNHAINPPSKFPSVRRDFAFLVDKAVAWQDVLTTAKQHAGDNLMDAWLFDVYVGDKLPDGKKSLAFALLWQDDKATLADEQIHQYGQQVINALAEQYQAVLRD